MPSKFVQVKRRSRSVGKSCMHCGKSATVTAIRKANGHRKSVRYCKDHADQIIGESQ